MRKPPPGGFLISIYREDKALDVDVKGSSNFDEMGKSVV